MVTSLPARKARDFDGFPRFSVRPKALLQVCPDNVWRGGSRGAFGTASPS